MALVIDTVSGTVDPGRETGDERPEAVDIGVKEEVGKISDEKEATDMLVR